MSAKNQGAHSKAPSYDAGATPEQTPPKGKKRKRNVASNILLIIGIALLVVALALFGTKLFDYYRGDKTYSDLAENATLNDYELDVDWASLRAINSQVVAWIQIPDTNVDYPVAQADDDDFYLHHSSDLAYNSVGCPFLDYENSSDLSDNNSFIFGHNMKNGSMFHDLAEFTDQSYFDSHQYAYIATPANGTKRYRIIGAFLASGSDQIRKLKFADQSDYKSYIKDLWNRCETQASGTDINSVTRTVLLSTCSYQFNDARTLLICVEVDSNGNMVNYPMSSASLTPRVTVTSGASTTTTTASTTTTTTS